MYIYIWLSSYCVLPFFSKLKCHQSNNVKDTLTALLIKLNKKMVVKCK